MIQKGFLPLITKLIETVYAFLWGDLFTLPVRGSSVGISLMLLLLIPAGVYFTIRTRLLPVRLFSVVPVPYSGCG